MTSRKITLPNKLFETKEKKTNKGEEEKNKYQDLTLTPNTSASSSSQKPIQEIKKKEQPPDDQHHTTKCSLDFLKNVYTKGIESIIAQVAVKADSLTDEQKQTLLNVYFVKEQKLTSDEASKVFDTNYKFDDYNYAYRILQKFVEWLHGSYENNCKNIVKIDPRTTHLWKKLQERKNVYTSKKMTELVKINELNERKEAVVRAIDNNGSFNKDIFTLFYQSFMEFVRRSSPIEEFPWSMFYFIFLSDTFQNMVLSTDQVHSYLEQIKDYKTKSDTKSKAQGHLLQIDKDLVDEITSIMKKKLTADVKLTAQSQKVQNLYKIHKLLHPADQTTEEQFFRQHVEQIQTLGVRS